MYEKMIQIDPNAPSEAEHRAQAVTKPRWGNSKEVLGAVVLRCEAVNL